MTKLNEDCDVKRRHKQLAKLSSKIRSKQAQNENATQGQSYCYPANCSDEKQATIVRVTLTARDTEGLPRQCPLCRRPNPPSTPPFDATIAADHRSHPSTPPIDATIRCHHSPTTTHQLLLHFGIVNPCRTSGSITFSGQYRRRAQTNFRCILSQLVFDSYLSTVAVPSHYHQVLRAIHQHLISQFSPSQSCHSSHRNLQSRRGQHHRRHRSHPGHRHHHSPKRRTHQLLLHFDIVNPSRDSGSISFPCLFRRRAQPNFQG